MCESGVSREVFITMKKNNWLVILGFLLWLPIPWLYFAQPSILAGQPLSVYAVALFLGGLSLTSAALYRALQQRMSSGMARVYVSLFVLALVGAYQFSGLAPSWDCLGKQIYVSVVKAQSNCTTTCTNNKKKPCGGWSSCWDKFVSCDSSGRDQDGRGCGGCCFSCKVVCEDPDPDPEPTYQPPTISGAVNCSQVGNNGWCIGDTVLILTASDPQNFSVTITGDIAGSTFACTVGDKTCTKNLPEGSGAVNYKVTASTSGLIATGSTTWKKDTNFPVANLVIPNPTGSNGWFKTAPVIVSITGSDTPSGLASAEMSTDAGTTWQASDLSLYTDGSHVVHYGAADLAGNRTDYSGQLVHIDTVPPALITTTTGAPGNANWYVSNVETTITATDETSGIDRVEYDLDDTGWQSGTVIHNHEGVNTISIRAYDIAGNVSITSLQNNVDTTPPVLTAILPKPDGLNGWYITGPVPVSANGFDSVSGLLQAAVSVNQGQWQPEASLLDGVYTVDFKSLDNAGNATTSSQTVKVDTLPPALSTSIVGTLGNQGWYVSQTTTTISAVDETSGVDRIQFQQNEGGWSVGAVVASTDGVNDIAVRAYDSAGNVSTDALQIKVDSIRPVSGFTSPLKHSTDTLIRGQYSFSGTSVDTGSGIAKGEISFDQKRWYPVVMDGENQWHFQWDTLNLPDGVYTAIMRATDVAGNQELLDAGAQVAFLVNNTPPHIKLTPEWLIWDAGALSISTDYFRVKEGLIVIADTQGRWPSVEIPFDKKYPLEIKWDRRFGNGILAPSGDYRVTVTACNIHDLCSEKSAVIKIPWYAVVLPTPAVPTALADVQQQPEPEIKDPDAAIVQPTAQPSVNIREPVAVQSVQPVRSLLPIIVLIALLWAISSSTLADGRPAAIRTIVKTIAMQKYKGEPKNE
jgi:hypothetical protein